MIHRRLFAFGAGFAAPLAYMEQARHGLLGSLAADRSAAGVEEWREIAREYGLDYVRTPPAELLGRLQADIAILGEALRHPRAESATRELHRVAALLAAFMAMTVGDLGDLSSARRWWRTAKRAADASGDVEARLWTRGEEVVSALYEQRPTPDILDLVAEADAVSASTDAPPAALAKPLAGKAQALAIAGRASDAEAALGEVRENFGRLPAHVAQDPDSMLGWSEHRLRHTESYVYSLLGDFPRAVVAQEAALAAYPATAVRGPVKIELHRSLCMVRAGDVAPGVELAHAAMAGLPREQHDLVIADLGHRVLDALPPADRGRDCAREFQAYLGDHVAV